MERTLAHKECHVRIQRGEQEGGKNNRHFSQPLAPNFLIQRVSSASNVKPGPMVINVFLCALPLDRPIIFLALSEPPQIQGMTVNEDSIATGH